MVRTALVTGAAAGIGRACALRLASDGHAVGILDLDLDGCEAVVKEIESGGGRAVALRGSVCERSEVVAAVDQLRTAFGPITIVVNNAGITGFVPFEEISDEDWDHMLAVNLKGTFIVTQVVLPDMKAERWGRVVNISSSSAQTGAINMAHYSASKGAVIALTRSLAIELGRFGITVNNIPPGAVMNTIMSEANREKFKMSKEDMARMIPVQRTGEPEDIAGACAWLASEGSGYVSGQTIGVNGGRVVS